MCIPAYFDYCVLCDCIADQSNTFLLDNCNYVVTKNLLFMFFFQSCIQIFGTYFHASGNGLSTAALETAGFIVSECLAKYEDICHI